MNPQEEHRRVAEIVDQLAEHPDVVLQGVDTDTSVYQYTNCTVEFALKQPDNDD